MSSWGVCLSSGWISTLCFPGSHCSVWGHLPWVLWALYLVNDRPHQRSLFSGIGLIHLWCPLPSMQMPCWNRHGQWVCWPGLHCRVPQSLVSFSWRGLECLMFHWNWAQVCLKGTLQFFHMWMFSSFTTNFSNPENFRAELGIRNSERFAEGTCYRKMKPDRKPAPASKCTCCWDGPSVQVTHPLSLSPHIQLPHTALSPGTPSPRILDQGPLPRFNFPCDVPGTIAPLLRLLSHSGLLRLAFHTLLRLQSWLHPNPAGSGGITSHGKQVHTPH